MTNINEQSDMRSELTSEELTSVHGGIGTKGLFEIEDYSFDIEHVLSIGSR